jgi:AhpD family alkylhydroperoxidase
MTTQFSVPTREQVAPANQAIFDNLKGALGFVPNLYAAFAYSDTALGTYLQLQNSPTTFSKKEKEAINLIVSQNNECRYCQSAHTVIGKMNGFSEEQVLEIRRGSATFNSKLDSLVKLAADITLNHGKVSNQNLLTEFFAQGYTKGALVDLIVAIADKVIMNYLHNITEVPIDFPVAVEIHEIA